ncbi:3-oxoadipate enol-lactonase [Massilia sp. BJB1822]|uniref:3-oxoadipate enol-lactonase n=1 Tax=Massilia sp. BJB1822 TaxID=2744470 RepID=UPI001594BD79|nr:3-oxoadipate enol-lactonase [Massilia sp. BJB1822]NVE01478.1 3-oxoadipate enol-lactonase [Massilia sp. BJB1822]
MEKLSFITAGDGVRIAYRLDGAPGLPVLMLSNSIATSHAMWDGQVAALAQRFRVLRYDTRGHGQSGVPAGAYSLDRLGRDVLELLDALGIERVHFLGLSLGGFIGQWLAIHAPERIDKLILSNTAAQLGPAAVFEERIAALRDDTGLRQTAETFLANWFPASMREAQAPVIDRFRAMVQATDPQGLAGAFAAVRDADLRRTIRLIAAPTLVIGGRHDTVTLAAHSEELAAAIPGARLVLLPAVHLSNVEREGDFLDAVLSFL